MQQRVYERTYNRGWGWSRWRQMLRDVQASRTLMWVLFKRNFFSTYRQTLFGWVGTVLDPLLMVAPFMTMAFAGILDPGDINAPYPAFALIGLTLYHIGNESIRLCGNAVTQGQSMVLKVNFAKEALVFSHLGTILINMAIRFAVVTIILLLYRHPPAWTAVFVPLAVLPMLVFGVGVGLVLACMSVVMRDVGKYVTMLMPFFLLMSPILYARPRLPILEAFNDVNPFAVLVNAPRDLILYGDLLNPRPFYIMSAACAVFFLLAWRLFHISQPHLSAQLGAK
ncbi:MAG: ABC transporter permease [Candidatus Hydrogenedentota bacterium]